MQTTIINDKILCGVNIFTDENIKHLNKKCGIKSIIDVNAVSGDELSRKKSCSEKNVEYVNVPYNPGFDTIQKLVEVCNKKGVTYINSDVRHNANLPIALNYLFNLDTTFPDALLMGTPRKQFLKHLKYIKNHLTPEQISKLGNDTNFDETFDEKIEILNDINQ